MYIEYIMFIHISYPVKKNKTNKLAIQYRNRSEAASAAFQWAADNPDQALKAASFGLKAASFAGGAANTAAAYSNRGQQ